MIDDQERNEKKKKKDERRKLQKRITNTISFAGLFSI